MDPWQGSIWICCTAELTNWPSLRQCPLETLFISLAPMINIWVSIQPFVCIFIQYSRGKDSYVIQIKRNVVTTLTVTHLFQQKFIISQHNPRPHWYVNQYLALQYKFCGITNRALAFATIHERPSPLPHYLRTCQHETPASLFSEMKVKNILQSNKYFTFEKLNNKKEHNQKFHGVWTQPLGLTWVSVR
jgi:hypothetical protein